MREEDRNSCMRTKRQGKKRRMKLNTHLPGTPSEELVDRQVEKCKTKFQKWVRIPRLIVEKFLLKKFEIEVGTEDHSYSEKTEVYGSCTTLSL